MTDHTCYTQEQLINVAHFTNKDIELAGKCRRQYNRIGFGYQLAFVRILNRFPINQPFEIFEDILTHTLRVTHIKGHTLRVRLDKWVLCRELFYLFHLPG